jgi:endonuclease III-like uncharacterized protein
MSYSKALATAVLNEDLYLEIAPVKTAQQLREKIIKIKEIGKEIIDSCFVFCREETD